MTLQWLVCATGRLGHHALLEALSITPGDTHLDPSCKVTEDDILRWCSSLVRRRADGDGIELAHFTVKEYLTHTETNLDSYHHEDPRLLIFKIRPKESDKNLGLVCLTYLNMSHLEVLPPDDLWENAWSSSDSDPSDGFSELDFSEDDSETDELREDNREVESIANMTIPCVDRIDLQFLSKKEEARRCLVAQRKELTKKPKVGASEAFAPYLRRYPLLDYAANNSFSHLASYGSDPLVGRLSRALFAKEKSYRFIWWSYAYMRHNLDEDWVESYPEATTLHWAAMETLPELCSWLIRNGSEVNRTSGLGSPLDCALGTIACLFKWDQDMYQDHMHDEERRSQDEPLDVECYEEVYSIVRDLVRAGAKLTAVTQPFCQTTPLGLALLNFPWGHELAQCLLDEGAPITKDVLQIIDDYFTRDNKNFPRSIVPSGMAIMLSDSVLELISDSDMPVYKQLLARWADHASSGSTEITTAPTDAEEESQIHTLENQFLQATQHGVYSSATRLASEIVELRPESTASIFSLGLSLAMENGHQDIAEYLLKIGANPNIADDCGNTPVHRLLQACNLLDFDCITRMIQLLLDFGADLSIRNDNGEQTIHLATASEHDNMLETVLGMIGNDQPHKFLEDTPNLLQYAIKHGSDSAIGVIVQEYVELDPAAYHDCSGTSLMGLAAMRATDVALRLLYHKGSSVEACSSDGSSVLFHAAQNESDTPFDFLLELDTDDTSSRSDGRKVIHELANRAMPSKLTNLLKRGRDANVQDSTGQTPLHLASILPIGQLDILLGAAGIDVDCQDATGMTPLMICCQNLVSFKQVTGVQIQHALVLNVQRLMKQTPNLLLVDEKSRTVLHFLCQHGLESESFSLTKALVALGASLGAKDDQGLSPFEMLFVFCVDPERSAHIQHSEDLRAGEVLQFIIENALDSLNGLLSSGLHPLAFALWKGSQLAVNLLIASSAVDIDIRGSDQNRLNSLETAARWGCSSVSAQALLSRTNNDLSMHNPVEGNTLLHWATVNSNDQALLSELLVRKPHVDALNKANETPLGTAIKYKNVAVAKRLLTVGANPSLATGSPKILPLHYAVKTGQLPIVRMLIDFGADVNEPSAESNMTALHYACICDRWDIPLLLVESHALLNERDTYGNTPYLAAAASKSWHVFRKMFTTSADLTATNSKGLNALHYAVRGNSISTVRFLSRNGPVLAERIVDSTGKVWGSTLTLAIEYGSLQLVQKFWHDGAEKTFTGHGWGLGHFAVHGGVSDDIRLYLEARNIDWNVDSADLPFISTKCGHSQGLCRPLHIAALLGFDSGIVFLNTHGHILDINVPSVGTAGYSSLHLAALGGRPSTVKLLTGYGADLDPKSRSDEQTPLHLAARYGHAGTVTVLLEASCAPNPVDSNGMTPELLAIENEHIEVKKILSEHLDALEAELETVEDGSSGAVPSRLGSKAWTLPLRSSPHTTDVMKDSNVTIYAIRDEEDSEEIRKALDEKEGDGVMCLGKPYRRRI